jgi:hypothetical protein
MQQCLQARDQNQLWHEITHAVPRLRRARRNLHPDWTDSRVDEQVSDRTADTGLIDDQLRGGRHVRQDAADLRDNFRISGSQRQALQEADLEQRRDLAHNAGHSDS